MSPSAKEATKVQSTSNSISADQKPACSFCEGHAMTTIMDFGEVALAGGFLRDTEFSLEHRFPLRLYFCGECYAVQIVDRVDVDILFKNYFYCSSAIRSLREHFVDYATEVVSRFLLEPTRSCVVEIGCNDGILLKPLANQQVQTLIGIDPATNIVQAINDSRINVINDFFSKSLAESVRDAYGAADLIVANNVYAHIPNIHDVTEGIHNLLADDGVFIFEVHYVGKVLHGFQYDMVYHEHLYYYSLIALINHFARFGMIVFDLKPIPIHAGSMRYYVCKNTSKYAKTISPRVSFLQKEELDNGLDRIETFASFAQEVATRKERLMHLLESLRIKGKRVAGYGASGRANTIIQYCGINSDHILYMIDDAPAKAGFYTPGSHFLIRTNDVLKEDPPDYLLNFAWSYFSEIAEKCRKYFEGGGRMILPLPDVRVMFEPRLSEEL